MSAMRYIYTKFNQGITILEMLVTLVIISGIVVMSLYYYSTATDVSDFKDALNKFQDIANTLTGVSPPWSPGAQPNSTKWGGVLTISAIGGEPSNCNKLINFSDMKRDTCMRLFTALNASSRSVDWHLYTGSTCPGSGRGSVTWIYTYPVCAGFTSTSGTTYQSTLYQLTP